MRCGIELYPVLVRWGIAAWSLSIQSGFTCRHGWLNGALGEKTLLIKIVLRERESAQEAVRRFRKLVERTGLKRELRRRERYEKPSDVKRRKKARAIRKARASQVK